MTSVYRQDSLNSNAMAGRLRARLVLAPRASSALTNLEGKLVIRLGQYEQLLSRLAMAVVYFWFGVLKLFGVSPANPLVESLQAKTVPFLSFHQFIILFALFEMLIGILFLVPKATRVAMVLFAAHMVTTIVPLFALPQMTWQSPLVPTMEGQYILKNVVLIALAASLGAHWRPVRRRLPAVTMTSARTVLVCNNHVSKRGEPKWESLR